MKRGIFSKGFSLIEFIVAFAIIMAVLLPVLEMSGALIKIEGAFYRKYGVRGNLSADGENPGTGDVEVIDANLNSIEVLLSNFIKNVRKLGFNDSPVFNANTGYKGLKSFAADEPKPTLGQYDYILNWEGVNGSKCAINSISGGYYLTYTGTVTGAGNVAYTNPGASPTVYSCYTYYGAKDLNGKKVTLTVTNGTMINMPSLNAVWNSATWKGNANIPVYDPPLTNFNFVKIRPNPEFIYLEATLETGEKDDAIVTPIENFCLNNS